MCNAVSLNATKSSAVPLSVRTNLRHVKWLLSTRRYRIAHAMPCESSSSSSVSSETMAITTATSTSGVGRCSNRCVQSLQSVMIARPRIVKGNDDRHDIVSCLVADTASLETTVSLYSRYVLLLLSTQLRLLPIRWNAINKVTISSLSHPWYPFAYSTTQRN